MLWAHLKRLMGDQEPRLAEAQLKSHTDSPAGPSIRENSVDFALLFDCWNVDVSMDRDH
jgi:hypothetical protein